MDKAELRAIVASHKEWLNRGDKGMRANLYRADLSGADLSGANLFGAILDGANLSGANLYGANLERAYLEGANLSGANLSGVSLYGVSLYGVNLYGANLDGADLSRANLSGVIGDGVRMKTLILPKYAVTICDRLVRIGCQEHSSAKWLEADPTWINSLADDATAWWMQWGNLVQTFILANEETP